MNLITLAPEGRIVVVGDTHGDFEATKAVIDKFLDKDTKIVFLGDYVDRGEQSRENIDFLLKLSKKHPKQVFLLKGNHETYDTAEFSPADFWESLLESEKAGYVKAFKKLPLALSVGSILMLHAAPPMVDRIEDIEKINENDENWKAVVWGDLDERE